MDMGGGPGAGVPMGSGFFVVCVCFSCFVQLVSEGLFHIVLIFGSPWGPKGISFLCFVKNIFRRKGGTLVFAHSKNEKKGYPKQVFIFQDPFWAHCWEHLGRLWVPFCIFGVEGLRDRSRTTFGSMLEPLWTSFGRVSGVIWKMCFGKTRFYLHESLFF